jgi:hypothetical protein
MHETFSFPIECKGAVSRRKNIKIYEYNGEEFIRGEHVEDPKSAFYNPFDYPELIPSFIETIEKILRGGNKREHIKRWCEKWGYLYDIDLEKNTVRVFWKEAIKFYKLWTFYKTIVNRDKKSIYKSITLEPIQGDEYKLTFFPNDESFIPNTIIKELIKEKTFNKIDEKIYHDLMIIINDDFDFKCSFPFKLDKNRDELEQIQEYSMMFLLQQIRDYIKNAELSWTNITHDRDQTKSVFKITPALHVNNLIDAIYLQFFILFSENQKKICPICNRPFFPERKDKKYCSDSCYLTAKSRRYRARKSAAV